MMRLSLGMFGLLALGFASTGCGGDDDAAPTATTKADIEVKGTWKNADFGETDVIDDATWSTDFGADPTISDIVEYSNSDRTAIVLAPADAMNNPSTYSELAWTKPADGVFYYCTVTYGCASADDAKHGDGDDSSAACNVSNVDASDLDGMGCGGFMWTKLTQE